MIRRQMIVVISVAFTLSVFSFISMATPASNTPCTLVPYSASYKIYRGKTVVGHVERDLRLTDPAKQLWQATMDSEAGILFYKITSHEQSVFKLSNAQVQPIHHQLREKRTFKHENNTVQDFNWQTMQEQGHKNERHWQRSFIEHSLDSLNYVEQLSIHLCQQQLKNHQYTVNDEGQDTPYYMMYQGEQTITTPLGALDTYLFTRIRKSNTRETQIWFAKKYHFTPVKIRQTKDGKEQANMLINQLTLHDKVND